jgi:hypothetical protein
MASLKNLTATFSTAVGPRRYILPSFAIAVGTLLDVGMLKFGILLDADGPFAYLPFVAGISIAAIMIIWWLLDYATKIRAEMGAIENIEQALDALSADFDEGNAKIFNGAVMSDTQYREWDAWRDAWQEKVQEHLQASFGLRERNLFRNLVLVQPLDLPGSYNAAHNHERCVVAQQLESLRATIVRYSDLAAKRRAESA